MDALAAPALFFWMSFFGPGPHKPTTEQVEVLQMLKELSGTVNRSTIVRVESPWSMMQLIDARKRVVDGGFLIIGIKEERDFLRQYFQKLRWPMMPFLYGESVVFQKPGQTRRSA